MKEKDSFWYSKINSSQTCLKKYQYQYVLDIAPEGQISSALEFGSAVHLGLEALFEQDDPVLHFETYWDSIKKKPIDWGRYDWQSHRDMGIIMLQRFKRLHYPHLEPILFEKRLYADMDGTKFEGTPDFYGHYKGVLSIVDFKTSSSRYMQHRLDVAQQLMNYAWLVERNGHDFPKQLVYIVFIKGMSRGRANPSIQVLTRELTREMVDATMANMKVLAEELKARREFPKNYGACLNYNSVCQFWDYCHKNKPLPGGKNEHRKKAKRKNTKSTSKKPVCRSRSNS